MDWHPGRLPGEVWDSLARQNAYSAICYHATPEWFAESGKRDAEALVKIMQAIEGLPYQSCVLDLGGGIGRIAKWLATAEAVCEYHLLDCSAEMLARAPAYLGEAAPRVTLHQGDGATLAGIADASIDFCFSWLVLQHCDREVTLSYLMDLRRVLRPEGAAFLHVPMMDWPARFAEAQRGDWSANFRRWQPGEFLEACARLGYLIAAAECDRGQFVLRPGVQIPWMAEGGTEEEA